MRVIVCGGREYADKGQLFSELDRFHQEHQVTCVIQGGARGADTLAGEWARFHGIPCVEVPADWEKHGRSAGHIRNQSMLECGPDALVAFPGGKGTAHMVAISKEAGLPVHRPRGVE